MNKKGNVSVGLLLILFIGIIVGFALLKPISDTTSVLTSKQTTLNKSIDVSDAYIDDSNVDESVNFTIYQQSDWKKADCPLSSVVIRNGQGHTLVKDADYVLYADDGKFSLKTTLYTYPSNSLNMTYVDYTYCADGYNTDSSSRSVAKLILVFVALGLVAWILEQSGVVNFGKSLGI